MTIDDRLRSAAAELNRATSAARPRGPVRPPRRAPTRIGLALVAAAAFIALGVLATSGHQTPHVSVSTAPVSPAVESITFPGGFTPASVLPTGGGVWVLGTTGTGDTSCSAVRLDPATLASRSYRLPACGGYAAAGGGYVYLAVPRYRPGTNTADVHIERLDTRSGKAEVLGPVVTSAPGSAVGHLNLSYGDGYLWMYPWDSKVLKISPTTGAVVESITGVPVPGGGHAVVAANRGGVWLAQGPGGDALLRRLPPGSSSTEVVYRAPEPGSILWVADTGRLVWAAAATFLQQGAQVQVRLVALDLSGHVVTESGPEGVGSPVVPGPDDTLWSVGNPSTCTGPQTLWRIDPSTGRSYSFASLAVHGVYSCVAPGESPLAVSGRFAFVAQSGSLYRVDLVSG